jgi:hypothetical protein
MEVEGRQMLGVEEQALVGLMGVKEVEEAPAHKHQCLCHSRRARGPNKTSPQSMQIKMGKCRPPKWPRRLERTRPGKKTKQRQHGGMVAG